MKRAMLRWFMVVILTTPEGFAQRLGAAIVLLAYAGCVAAFLALVFQGGTQPWTLASVALSAWCICLMILILPMGLIHGVAVLWPSLLARWRPDSGDERTHFVLFTLPDIGFFYAAIGWIAMALVPILMAISLTG